MSLRKLSKISHSAERPVYCTYLQSTYVHTKCRIQYGRIIEKLYIDTCAVAFRSRLGWCNVECRWSGGARRSFGHIRYKVRYSLLNKLTNVFGSAAAAARKSVNFIVGRDTCADMKNTLLSASTAICLTFA